MKQRDWNSFGRDVRVLDPNNSNTPAGLALRWLDWLQFDRGRSPATRRRYELTCEQWLDWAATSAVDPLLPTLEELEAFIRRPRKRQAKGQLGAPATRRAEVTHLKGWYTFLADRGLNKGNPAAQLLAPTVRPSLPKPIPDDHWVVLWESDLTPRVRLALGLGFYCGLRRKEITTLHGNQITSELIINFERKGGGEDTLPWAQMLSVYLEDMPRLAGGADLWAQALEDHARRNRSRILFWNDGHQMYKEMKKACQRVELPEYTPHQLRHSCATNLCRAGMPVELVSSLLNHSSLDITKRYVRAGGSELREWRNRRSAAN